MNRLNHIAIRLYRRLFGGAHAALVGGGEAVLDGATAVAVTEAGIAGGAAFGGGLADAELAWREQGREGHDRFGEPAAAVAAEGPRGAFAAAIGQALAGRRTALFLSGPELAGALDLLANAAGRHLPLVVQLANRALPAQGEAAGSSHEALHLAAESGCAVLIAATVQEAVDLTLIAHRLAESALVPVVVAQDLELTARSAQEVNLPSQELIEHFLGAAGEEIPSATPAQELLFGESRRRLPCWHDLDRPLLTGALAGPDAFALGAAAGPFFDAHLGALLDQAFAEFGRLTGRGYGRLASHNLDGAKRVLLLQGGAAEAAYAAADSGGKERLGVVALRCLRPSPMAELAQLLAGRQAVAVLERRDQPLVGDPPLLRELRAALLGMGARTPALHSVIYGSGGLPLRGADLLALAERLKAGAPERLFLGLRFHTRSADHPKRQVMLDRLRRAYPQLAELGLKATEGVDLRPAGALSLAVLHRGGEAHALAGDAGALLQRLAGGVTRGRPGAEGEWVRDRLLHAPAGPGYVGDDLPLDALLVTSEGATGVTEGLVEGGLVLLAGAVELAVTDRAAARRLSLRLYRFAETGAEEAALPVEPLAAELANARRLGGLFGALVAAGRLEQNRRKLATAWEATLGGLEEGEREALTAAFEAGFDAVEALVDEGEKPSLPSPSDEVPTVVRHLGGDEESYASLPRFWDQVGVLYRDGEAGRLTADPYLATGTMPPLSATFRDLSAGRTMLPGFDPDACNGCGACWSACPDSAIGAVAMTPMALIQAGIQAVKGDALRPLAAKLAGRVSAMGRSDELRELRGAAAGELLRGAWAWLQEKSPLAEERRAAVEPLVEALARWAGELPLAVTEALFRSGERAKRDGGELLSLAINPDACKGCGLCVRACPEGAMTAESQDGERLARARRLWHTWQATPDTASETIERVAREGALSTMAALLLSRYCALALAGGDPAEPGSGEKIALRLALAAAEYQQQPLLHRFTRELGELRERLIATIRETLSEALPTDDLDALAAGLRNARDGAVNLSQLGGGGKFETARVQRLVALARDLDREYQALSKGHYGLGRARFGLAVAGGSVARWAGTFPYNPFQAPVALDATGDAGQLAAGLVSAQVGAGLRTLELVERAQRELGEAKGPRGEEVKALAWEGLDEERKRLCAPLILVGNEEQLGGRGLAQVAWLLNSGLPVKILVLSELDLGLDTRRAKGRPLATRNDPRSDLGLMALAQRNAYVAQSSIAEPGHYREAVREALRFPGPALIRVHAPSPLRHGFKTDAALEQARLAVAARVLPLFRYQPQGEGVFGSRLTLEGNPEPRSAWGEVMPWQWAAREARFAGHFSPLTDDAPAPVEASAWLALDEAARAKKTPFVTLGDGEAPVRYRVSTELLAQVARLGHAWRTLQELAGLVTPFTERVRREAEEQVAEAHRAELEALRREADERLAEQAAGMQGQIAGQLRERLLSLAGYR